MRIHFVNAWDQPGIMVFGFYICEGYSEIVFLNLGICIVFKEPVEDNANAKKESA